MSERIDFTTITRVPLMFIIIQKDSPHGRRVERGLCSIVESFGILLSSLSDESMSGMVTRFHHNKLCRPPDLLPSG